MPVQEATAVVVAAVAAGAAAAMLEVPHSDGTTRQVPKTTARSAHFTHRTVP